MAKIIPAFVRHRGLAASELWLSSDTRSLNWHSGHAVKAPRSAAAWN
jgi:hypothetical protein